MRIFKDLHNNLKGINLTMKLKMKFIDSL
jgi:hypothetical protein